MRGKTREEEQTEFGRRSEENNSLSGCGGTRTDKSPVQPQVRL